MRVHVELLARLGVLHDERADVRQLGLARIEQPHGQNLVAPVEQIQRSLPAGRADEVRDDKDQRSALDRASPAFEQRCQVRERRGRQAGILQEVVDQAQHLRPSAAWRNRALDGGAAVEHRADPVPVTR